ncbi:PTS sugar transporter subunit IIB [Acetonema longum]|uniref:Phosphotransferase system lactose/cellobiose-specific IIB subunit n=1 Tax=Acetonema longum DSM 6540 TaxID=1009370 RepID=F7NMV4_9FIRM|nr:PTS sugar transporter subunit IIB [Acetonema longum]EGO62648.1 phosphotransferase system lactose/cellobiose-specific IIB subunit [Acetonema longum DSM 6540]
MVRIMLVCSSGMSTSLLVCKMNTVAVKEGIQAKVTAIAEADLKNNMNNMDVLLLGPQVKFLLTKLKDLLEPKGVPVDVIDFSDYGTMNGKNVLEHALRLVKDKAL